MPRSAPSAPPALAAPELALLLMDLLCVPSQAARAHLAGLDPDARARLAALARAQRVLAPLVRALEQAGVEVPPELVRPGRRAIAHALALQAEALRLHRMLEGAGIAHRFLKGVVLAGQVYPVPWARPMRDIDILLVPADLPRAHAALAAAGGVMERHAHKDPAATGQGAKHLPPLFSPQRLIGVELHGHVVGADSGLGPRARAALDAALWAGPVPRGRVGAQTLPAPGAEAMLVHLVVHGVHDHELNNGPILICDMCHLLHACPPDPARLAALVETLGIGRAMALALSLLPEGLVAQAGLAHLRDAGPALPRATAAALLFQDPAGRHELRLAADLAQAGPGARLWLLARRACPARATLLERWQMERGATPPPRLWGALWLWFLRTRWQQMRARRAGAGQGATGGAAEGADPRAHLLRLRALRDGAG